MAVLLKNPNKGSTLFESCILLSLLCFVFVKIGLLFVIHFYAAWIHLWNYEMSICLSKNRAAYFCKMSFKNRTEKLLRLIKIKRIKIKRTKKYIESKVEWKTKDKTFLDKVKLEK